MLIDRRGLRIGLGVLWMLDAALQLQPTFFHPQAWQQNIAQSVMGEPPWVAHGIFWAIGVISAHPAVWNACFASLQAALGLALLTDRLPRLAIAASVPYAIGVWWVGEGFGALPTGFASLFAGAPGPAVLYGALGLLAWPTRDPSAIPGTAGPPAPHAGSPTVPPGRRPIGGPRRRHGRQPVRPAAATAMWVALWAGQALLLVPWVYPVRQVLTANLEENALDAPQWLLPAVHWASNAVASAPTATVAVLAAAQVLVGLGVLHTTTRRPALAMAVALTVLFWVLGQDFGGALTAGGTDPGTAPLLLLLAGVMWPTRSAVFRRDLPEIPSTFAMSP